MKQVLIAIVLVSLVAVVGCQKKGGTTKPAAATGAVTDITPTQGAPSYTPAPTYTPAPAYTPATPVVSDVTTTPNTPAANTAGSTYTVKKGDTLFSIAKSHYGATGVTKNVEKITAANPGLTASNLKAGQKITIP